MHALCNAFLSHRPTLMSPFSKGLRKNCRFQLWPWHFLGRTGSPLLCPTLCRPKISGSAYFGKSRGNQTWRLSHSVKAYPQFRSSYSHEEMVEHFLLTPAELQLVLTCRGDANRCGMALLLKTISHLGCVPGPMPEIPEEVRHITGAYKVKSLGETRSNCRSTELRAALNCHSVLLLLSPDIDGHDGVPRAIRSQDRGCKDFVIGAFQLRHFSESGRRLRTGNGAFCFPC